MHPAISCFPFCLSVNYITDDYPKRLETCILYSAASPAVALCDGVNAACRASKGLANAFCIIRNLQKKI